MIDKRRNYLELVQPVCQFCGKPFRAFDVVEAHHAGKHDTDGNNKNWPRYTQSLMCRILGCEHCHKNNPGAGRVPDWIASDWERILQCFDRLVKGGADVNLNLLSKELEIRRDEIITGRK